MFGEKTMEASVITGTGAYQVNTGTSGVGSFSAWRSTIGNGKTAFYYAQRLDGTIWEAGWGTLTYGSPDTLSRNLIASSTGSLVAWVVGDAPIYVFSAPSMTFLAGLLSGYVARPAWAPANFRWADITAGVATRIIDKIFNGTADVERGRYEGVPGVYVPSPRRPYLAKGAASYVVTANDIGWRFSFDTSAAARAMTLPAGSSVGMGFTVEGIGLSSANAVNLTPNGTDVIDYGAGGALLAIPGKVPFSVRWDGDQWRSSYVPAAAIIVQVVRSYLAGLALSAAGGSATFGIAAGVAADSTNVSMMNLAAFTKTASAWALGTAAGALDTGTITASTWYHVYLIQRPDTGVVDVLVSLSATAPTMPTNYTLKRRLGSLLTDGSSKWVGFTQLGDSFLWTSPPVDANAVAVGATESLIALTVPTGLIVEAMVRAMGIGFGTYAIHSPSQTAETVGTQAAPTNLVAVSGTTGNSAAGNYRIFTNTAAQIATVCSTTGALTIATDGWVDHRGRDT